MHRLDWPIDQGGYKIIELEGEFGLYGGSEFRAGMVPHIVEKGGPKTEYSPMVQQLAIHRELAILEEEKSSDEEVLIFCGKYGLLAHEWTDTNPSTSPSLKLFPCATSIHPIMGPTPTIEVISIEHFWHLQKPVREAVAALDSDNKLSAFGIFNYQKVATTIKLEHNPKSGKYTYTNIPINLNAAIWLLIEQEISGERNWLRCQNCRSWFIPKTKRAVYCRQACKVAWHRKQKQGV